MLELLKDRSVIFFDVGYTLVRPPSGDWMFTNRFLELAGERLEGCPADRVRAARTEGLRYLERNHLVRSEEEEAAQFRTYYGMVSDALGLGLTEEECRDAARDRTYNMDNYVLYPDTVRVLETLVGTHRLGVISDTWPSIENQLRTTGVRKFFSFVTYSCALGVFKPDRRMYLDALAKCGRPAEETVFIDDSPRNLEGAAALGITPILIAAEPAADAETPFIKIRSLSELV